MKVKEVMTPDAKAIWITESLADAAKEMWENDCGALPIIKDGRKVVGMITDRDICIASATRSKPPAEIRVSEVISANHGVHAVKPDDDVRIALRAMRKHRVRRLPVVDREQRLTGIVSINDLAINASPSLPDSVPAQEFLETFQAICAHEKHAVA